VAHFDADLVVVGAGIIGLATARELSERRPDLRIRVLEREHAVGLHQTGTNSGVAHAGIYYTPNSLKARLCVDGIKRMYAFCEERGIAHERCGKLIVALDESELDALAELERRGHANGVPGLRRVDADGLREIEPHATGVAALHSPHTGIVDFGAVARALASELNERGAEVRLNNEVAGLRSEDGHVVVTDETGETRAQRALICAGFWTDRLAHAAGAPADPRIVGFRGAYLRLRPESRGLVRGLIYPVPNPHIPFLGVHLTKRIDGEILLGPTAIMDARGLHRALAWPGTWRMMGKNWRAGLTELRMRASRKAFVAACTKYVPALTDDDVIDGPYGVRAQAVGRDGALVDDFVVHDAAGGIFVRNAPSPAATSSLALGRLIADRVQETLR
jgi:L-2-hydroxyglutarate oxidase